MYIWYRFKSGQHREFGFLIFIAFPPSRHFYLSFVTLYPSIVMSDPGDQLFPPLFLQNLELFPAVYVDFNLKALSSLVNCV